MKIKDMMMLVLLVALSMAFVGCGGGGGDDSEPVVSDITEIVPPEVLANMEALGMPVYRGNNPPNIEGRYKSSPHVLVDSNFDDSYNPGYQFADYIIRFSEQNNSELTIVVDYEQADYTGNGVGGFIFGDNNEFTVVVTSMDIDNDGVVMESVEAYSGTITENGIENFYSSIFLVDDGGDPDNDTIENGEGRVFKDQDGLAERFD